MKEFTDYLAEKDTHAQHIKAFIESGNADDEIQEAVKEAIHSADISVESLFWGIEELDVLDIDEIEYTPYIISVYDEGIAKVGFAVTCKVTVYYKYTDENESYYDKEDQCYLWQKIVELEETYAIGFDMVLSLDVSNCKPEMDEEDEEIIFEDYTESPSCIELEEDSCISTEVVSETDPFYEEPDGERDYATDICPDCGSPIGIENDGGNGFCINCAPNH